jgi:hypothetical protein
VFALLVKVSSVEVKVISAVVIGSAALATSVVVVRVISAVVFGSAAITTSVVVAEVKFFSTYTPSSLKVRLWLCPSISTVVVKVV